MTLSRSKVNYSPEKKKKTTFFFLYSQVFMLTFGELSDWAISFCKNFKYEGKSKITSTFAAASIYVDEFKKNVYIAINQNILRTR